MEKFAAIKAKRLTRKEILRKRRKKNANKESQPAPTPKKQKTNESSHPSKQDPQDDSGLDVSLGTGKKTKDVKSPTSREPPQKKRKVDALSKPLLQGTVGKEASELVPSTPGVKRDRTDPSTKNRDAEQKKDVSQIKERTKLKRKKIEKPRPDSNASS